MSGSFGYGGMPCDEAQRRSELQEKESGGEISAFCDGFVDGSRNVLKIAGVLLSVVTLAKGSSNK